MGLLYLSASLLVHAADPVQNWVARYDVKSGEDVAVDIAYDSAGNSYVTGYSQNGGSYYDWATVKYGPTGNRLWVKIYNGGNAYEKPAAIAVDGSGRVYVTGVRAGVGGGDIATIKYDTNGNVLWTKTYNNAANNGADYATALAIDSAGNVYVTGVSSGGSCCIDDYITIKYNANGTQLWAKRYNSPYSSTDHPTAIAVDRTGNVYVTGYSWYSATTRSDYVTIKYDASGNQKWLQRYSGLANTNLHDRPRGIAIDKDGNIIVTGQSGLADSGSSSGDYATLKYNPAGSQLWVKRFDGNAHAQDDAKAVAVDGAGNIFVTGWSYTAQQGVQTLPAYATVKYSPAGSQLWVRLYRGPGKADSANAIALDASGNVYVTGESLVGSFLDHYYDYATVKYNTNGAQQWVKTYNGPSTPYADEDVPVSIAVNSANQVFVTGWSWGNKTGKDYATIKYSQP